MDGYFSTRECSDNHSLQVEAAHSGTCITYECMYESSFGGACAHARRRAFGMAKDRRNFVNIVNERIANG